MSWIKLGVRCAAVLARLGKKPRSLVILVSLFFGTSVHHILSQESSRPLSPTEAYKSALAPFTVYAPGSTHLTLFLNGIIGTQWGLYRSTYGGVSWIRINDDAHQWGGMGPVCGDMRTFGSVYVAARSIVWGTSAYYLSLTTRSKRKNLSTTDLTVWVGPVVDCDQGILRRDSTLCNYGERRAASLWPA